jgi:hypothetical protein
MTMPQEAVDAWNAEVKVGDPVTYQNDFGELIPTRTRSNASVLSGHTAVIWLYGIRGCVALDRVKR